RWPPDPGPRRCPAATPHPAATSAEPGGPRAQRACPCPGGSRTAARSGARSPTLCRRVPTSCDRPSPGPGSASPSAHHLSSFVVVLVVDQRQQRLYAAERPGLLHRRRFQFGLVAALRTPRALQQPTTQLVGRAVEDELG